ncbi:hypothetical protein SOVF_201110 [Spinacia oleracea]|nr:hypothetical protein SOVF_201110 [Spinacia oleracea]
MNCFERKLDLFRVQAAASFYEESGTASLYGIETCSTELALGNTTGKAYRSTRMLFGENDATLGTATTGTCLNLSTMTKYKAIPVTMLSVDSPKRPRNGGVPVDLDKSFLSLAMSGFREEDTQGNKKNKVNGTSTDSADIRSYSNLCYEPPQLRISKSGQVYGVDYVENNDFKTNSPLYFSTPPSHVRTPTTSGGSPESILRNSAMSFNVPSIIRRKSSSNSIRKGMGRKDVGKAETLAAHKSVERCLELSFDEEADLVGLKCGTSVATLDDGVSLKTMSIS